MGAQRRTDSVPTALALVGVGRGRRAAEWAGEHVVC